MTSWLRATGAPSVGAMSSDLRLPPRASAVVVRVLTAPFTARAWRATIYAALSGLVGLASFIVFWVLTAVGIGLVFALLIGVLVLWGALLAAHQLARFEGWRSAVSSSDK